MIDKKPTKAQWNKMVEQLTTTDVLGFSRTVRHEKHSYDKYGTVLVTFKNDDGIEIEVRVSEEPQDFCFGDGSTTFTTKLGRRTFDRLGVESSFYIDTPGDIHDIVERQVKKVTESRKRMDDAVAVPGLQGSFTVTPEERKKISENLRAGRTHRFTPSGFGTGYALSIYRANRWSERANAETTRFFDVQNLYIDRMDCD